MKLLRIKVNHFGWAPCAEHNYPCPVYQDEPSVLNLSTGLFHPSWKAQREGYKLVHLKTKLQRVIYELFFRS